MKWNKGPHSHVCPFHGINNRCEAPECSDPYVRVCADEHGREMLQAYIVQERKARNEEAREAARDARAAFQEGVWTERESSERDY